MKAKEDSSAWPELIVGELDQMNRNYSDRLVTRVASACDDLQREAPDEESRMRALQFKLTVALAAYDIVTRSGSSLHVPGAEQHLVDFAILTELEAIH